MCFVVNWSIKYNGNSRHISRGALQTNAIRIANNYDLSPRFPSRQCYMKYFHLNVRS